MLVRVLEGTPYSVVAKECKQLDLSSASRPL